MSFDLFEGLGMNRTPDWGTDGTLRCGTTGERVDVVQTRHVFDGDFDAEVETLEFTGADDGHGAIDRGVERRLEFGQRLVGGRRGGFELSFRFPRGRFELRWF